MLPWFQITAGRGVAVIMRGPRRLGQDKVAAATRFGRIPGAFSLDQARFYDTATNRLKSKDALFSLLPNEIRAKDDAEVVSYCNTGS